MAISATPRCSAKCVRCGAPLVIPEWSETVGAGQAIHIWHCPVCEHEFDTIDNVVEPTVSEDELIQRFLPNLLVA